MFASRKDIPEFWGHSAAPNPNNCDKLRCMRFTEGSVRGLNRSENNWLPLSPKLKGKQHRWRESSYVIQVDQWMVE